MALLWLGGMVLVLLHAQLLRLLGWLLWLAVELLLVDVQHLHELLQLRHLHELPAGDELLWRHGPVRCPDDADSGQEAGGADDARSGRSGAWQDQRDFGGK
jgi:hypothetical protein